MEILIAALALLCSSVPTVLFLRNLSAYRQPDDGEYTGVGVSVLIPARNEELTIETTVKAALASQGVRLEVIVLDDDSTDGTSAILHRLTETEARLKVVRGTSLQDGWCGKQHACAELASHASYPILCFIDADVVLQPEAVARMARFLETSKAQLASGVPRQETVSLLERLLIPLIHFILLAFLPMRRMQRTVKPSYAAGCGQLFVIRAASYLRVGGHGSIRSTLHDGINLPKAFRRAGMKTDLFDATGIATCRMYTTNREVWRGLGKNAAEGLGSPRVIVPMTLILTLGQIVPSALAILFDGIARQLLLGAVACSLGVRLWSAWRFQQSVLGAILHPIGIALLLVIQWQALLNHFTGRQVRWKGRAYTAI